jgi:hypothetical protein
MAVVLEISAHALDDRQEGLAPIEGCVPEDLGDALSEGQSFDVIMVDGVVSLVFTIVEGNSCGAGACTWVCIE